MTTLECLSHELLLCIWDNLSKADAIFSFSQLNQRFTSLLIRHCDLHHKLNLLDSSLATCRFLCRDVATSSEWRSNLTTLRLGNQFNYDQLDLLADEVMAAIQSQPCGIDSGVFPRLISFRVDQLQWISDEVRDTLLYRVANASTLRIMNWITYRQQSHHALPLFNWLFLHSPNIHLTECQLQSPFGGHRFELTFCQTIAACYSPHHSLAFLTIDVRNWSTLHVLLHYLPRLKELGESKIRSTSFILSSFVCRCSSRQADQDGWFKRRFASDVGLSEADPTFDVEVRRTRRSLVLIGSVFWGRYVNVSGHGWNRVEKLILRLGDLMEKLTLTMHYCSSDAPYFLANADPFSEMCQKLHQLRSVRFNISVKLFIAPTRNNLAGFTRSFRTDYWLHGPLGRVCVSVDHHRIRNAVQIHSLPYNFSDILLERTVDFLDMQFNTQEEELSCPLDTARLLKSSLVDFVRLSVYFSAKESVPLAFLRALQSGHGKSRFLAAVACSSSLFQTKDWHCIRTEESSRRMLENMFNWLNSVGSNYLAQWALQPTTRLKSCSLGWNFYRIWKGSTSICSKWTIGWTMRAWVETFISFLNVSK